MQLLEIKVKTRNVPQPFENRVGTRYRLSALTAKDAKNAEKGKSKKW
jgi:hypothetical protein